MPRTEAANEQIREEARASILKAARTVFTRRGPAATISEIAAEAGVSQGLAYRYFPSKEAILTTLIKQAAESGGGFSGRMATIPGTPAERLRELISRVLEARRREPEFYQFFYQVMSDPAISKELRDVVRRSGNAMHEGMRKLVVEGQASGEIARDDPDMLVGAIMAFLDGISRKMLGLSPDEARRSIPDAKVVFRMLRPDEESRRR